MTLAARTTTHVTPRYGGPAEVAAYLGVSVKTVRRQVDSGALPSYRVGRRVLVAYRDADQLVRRSPPMSAARKPDHPLMEPTRGRLRPLSEDESRARTKALARLLDDMGEITDETDTDEAWSEAFRDLDAGRPDRPLFEGQY